MSIPFYSNLVALDHITVKNDVLSFSLAMSQKFASIVKHRFLVTILLTLMVSLYYTIANKSICALNLELNNQLVGRFSRRSDSKLCS